MQTDQDAVLEQLCSPQAYPHSTVTIRRIETHISWVYLTGNFAYKIKKAVKLPYLDFSTLEKRERACRDELSLNRRLAPALYHEVVGIGGDARSVRIGATPAVEFAVKITQFPDGAIADQLLDNDSLTATDLAGLARQLAEFHQTLEPATAGPRDKRILTNLSELESAGSEGQAGPIAEIGAWLRSAIARWSDRIADRDAAGRIRECHGDLHLGNIVRIDGRLIAFDCLEFSRDLRTIDVIDEVSFLFMDLMAHQRLDLAFGFLNDYLEVSGDFSGLRLLRLYATHRALVRAKVEPAGEANRYLETALELARSTPPFCLITHGLSGSGKTTIAGPLAARLNAVHLRSDVERKRLHGLESTDRENAGVEQGLYAPDKTEAIYRHLAAMAEAALDGGIGVIVDASFLSRRYRDLLRSLASKRDARFAILNLEAPVEVLEQRIAQRNRQCSDASDADLSVLDHQLKTADTFGPDEAAWIVSVATDTAVDTDRLAATIRSHATQPSLSSTSN
jgi:hypothetical protein